MIAGCAHPPIRTAPWDKKVSGSIAEIDKDDFRFIVNVFNSDSGITNVFQFKTNESTHYVHAAGFHDLNVGDWAVVEFTQNGNGELAAQDITLRKSAPKPPEPKTGKQKHPFLE